MNQTASRLLILATVAAIAWSAHAEEVPPPGLPAGAVYHRIFVTSFDLTIVSFNDFPPDVGEFGSITGGDWNVNYAASQAGLLPGWNEQDLFYRAILSDLTTNARDHVTITGPIYNMGNELVATDAADLWDGSLLNAIRYDEEGFAMPDGTRVWTGTGSTGLKSVELCSSWSNPNEFGGTVGDPISIDGTWTFNGSRVCNTSARLYGLSNPLTAPVPEPSSMALAATALIALLSCAVCRRLSIRRALCFRLPRSAP